MSTDRRAEPFALTILIVVLLGLAVAWLAGCASGRPLPPEPPAPTPERMATLLDAPVASPGATRPLGDVTLVVYPRVVLWGGAVRLRCLVSDAHEARGAVRLALEDNRVTTVELPNAFEQSILIERLPCGRHVASCTVVRQGKPTIVRTDAVDVRGGVCEDGGGK